MHKQNNNQNAPLKKKKGENRNQNSDVIMMEESHLCIIVHISY